MKLNAQVIVRACSGLNFILIWGGIWLDDKISSNCLFYPLMTIFLLNSAVLVIMSLTGQRK
ncbi:MAG: hypothetical protein ACFN06_05150 [Limosilactobacillus oris]